MEVELEAKSLAIDLFYIEGIREGRKAVLDEIYRKYFPKIQHLVLRNSGTTEDAKDIFQEVLVAIYHNVLNSNFKLTCQFGTYLHSVSRNLWLKQLRKRNISFTNIDVADTVVATDEFEEVTLRLERYQLYKKKFAEIGEQCQKLLLRFMQGANMKTIAEEFGFASVAYAKKRKFQCKEQLITRIEQDQDYKKIMIGE